VSLFAAVRLLSATVARVQRVVVGRCAVRLVVGVVAI
jgi:hypothetical protein